MPMACLSTAGLELDLMTGWGGTCAVWGVLRLFACAGAGAVVGGGRGPHDSWLRSERASWFSLVDEPSSSSSLDDEL